MASHHEHDVTGGLEVCVHALVFMCRAPSFSRDESHEIGSVSSSRPKAAIDIVAAGAIVTVARCETPTAERVILLQHLHKNDTILGRHGAQRC
jgi:hypothetical protein